ncbi:MAG: BACON domain-containing protein [Bacteroidales bacterium]|nr:BACON domain-containing protein [Bacteroidales bacterium]
MKKIVSILSTVVLVAASCQKPVEPSLSLKDQEISAPAAGLEQTVTFQTNQDWSATPDAGWVTVTPASGSAADGSATITVSVVKNDTFDARSAKVSVKAGPLSATITVNQAGKDVVFTLSDQQLNAEAAGLEKTIEFESNTDWTASSDASWLTVTPASGKASDAKVSITIKAEENDTFDARTAKINVTAGKNSAVITVSQAGKDMVFTLSDQQINAETAGLEKTIEFESNADWTASSDASWLTVTPASGKASDAKVSITIKAEKNETFDARTAKVNITAGENSAVITVSQAGKDVIFTLSDQQLNAETAGLEKTIEFESNADWTASSDASWLTVTPASGKASDAKVSITIKAEKNTLAKTRNAKVSVSAGSKSAVITVNQEAAPAYVKVTPASDKPFGYSGLETSISVESNAAWTVSCDAGWLEVSPSNGEGNGTVNVKAGMNEGNDKRIAKLVFTAADATAEVTVEQKGKETDGDNESFDPLPGYEW